VITVLKRLRPSKRDRDVTPTAEHGRSRFERGLLAVMGPAQVGENKPREGYVPDEAANLCPKCGQPWDVHGRVHTGKMTYRPCPAPQD
jgi:hypothetical protein